MAFAHRRITIQFKLGQGAFGEGFPGEFGEDGSDTVELTGLRCSANITKVGGANMNHLDLQVWGVPFDIMCKLTLLNQLATGGVRMNQVTVYAGDDVSGMSLCFVGTIVEAWADMKAAPDVGFQVSANAAYIDAIRPVVPVSYKGSVDAASVLQAIAEQMNPPRVLENSGVSVIIDNPYLPGTAKDQIDRVAAMANINASFEDPNIVAIWPADGSRGGEVALISPETGLVGYPAFTQTGIDIVTIYNPSLRYGAKVELQSSFTQANGYWVVASMSHNLDAEIPGGQWFTRIRCGLFDRQLPVAAAPGR